jgi:hypothetical protein
MCLILRINHLAVNRPAVRTGVYNLEALSQSYRALYSVSARYRPLRYIESLPTIIFSGLLFILLISYTVRMTDRHIFNDHTTLVLRSLKGLVATHPYLSLIPSLKVVYRADHDPSKVSLICGGGSGHEPGTVGFVGQGLLNASVAGDVFASPSARQVFGAIERVGSEKGVILIITNCECRL